jgi:7tm Chemosensory receptor
MLHTTNAIFSPQLPTMAGEKDIYYSAKFFYYILKCLGLAPYTFDGSTRTFRMGLSNYLLLIFSFGGWLSLNYFQLKVGNKTEFSGVSSNLLDQLWVNQYLIQHFFATFTVIYSFIKQKHVEKFLALIHKFDESVVKFQEWPHRVTHSRYYVLSVFSFCMIVMSIFILLAFFVAQPKWSWAEKNTAQVDLVAIARTFVYVIVTEVYLMLSMQFILSVYCISSRLRAIMSNMR